jgi:mannose-1-phosphate guanylyltransferase
MEQFVRPGDVISVAAGCKHVLIAETDMNIIEVQTGTEISQDDKKVFDIND